MGTVTATWTGYVARAGDGTILIPGQQVEVDEQVAAHNPSYVLADSDAQRAAVTAAAEAQATADQQAALEQEAAAAQAAAIAAAEAEAATETGATP